MMNGILYDSLNGLILIMNVLSLVLWYTRIRLNALVFLAQENHNQTIRMYPPTSIASTSPRVH